MEPTEAELAARRGEANEASSLLDETIEAARHHKQIMADWRAAEHRATPEGRAAAASQAAKRRDLLAAFRVFDADGSGKLSFAELQAILQRSVPGNAPMSDADIRALIERFDGSVAGSERDGMLDVAEFVQALTSDAAVEATITSNDRVLLAQYQRRFDENEAAIVSLFEALDADGSGYIDVGELEPVATLLHGEAFVKEDYLRWYDTNGKGDGRFDLKEFGWYVADCADCQADQMAEWIQRMRESIATVNKEKRP